VVRDASSGSGHELPTGSSPDADGRSPQIPTSNLTQELAQLLAASIARQQGGSKVSGLPTNAGLTSLASLVSANSAQRTLAPVFKDGLSALSYSQPRPKPAQAAEPEPVLELHDPHPDDEPMPIPSTWSRPTYGDDERTYRQQMGAALLGLAAGLAIVVPVVLWMSGWFDAHKGKPGSMQHVAASASASPNDLKAAEVRTVKVQVRPVEQVRPPEKPAEVAAQYVTGSVEPQVAVASGQVALEQSTASALAARFSEPQPDDGRARLDNLLAQANRRVSSGDVMGAREMLGAAEEASQGPVSFALAETYDPNMLAAWGSRGVASDVARARALYRKALDSGVMRAQARLEALK
jgi:hypothetical protein